MDGSAMMDYGRVAPVEKEDWIRAVREQDENAKEAVWKLSRLTTSVDAALIERWGFLSPKYDNGGGNYDRRYEVARLLLASGDRNGLRKHQYYASSVMTGGASTFWPIEFHSLEATDFGEFSEPGSPISSDVEETDERGVPRFEIKFHENRQAQYMLELDTWFLANLDKPKRIRGPGNRGLADIPPLYQTNYPVFCFSPHGQCIRAALANALHFLDGESAAKELLSKGRVRVQSLAHAGTWLEKNMKSYSLRNVDIPKNAPEAYWLYCQEEGVFIVSLDGRDRYNESSVHAVVVDTARRQVLDCAEKRVLRFVRAIFDLCVGDGIRFKRFLEIKRIVRQDRGKRKRKPHKVSREKQRMLRVTKREERREELEKRPRCNKRIVVSDEDE